MAWCGYKFRVTPGEKRCFDLIVKTSFGGDESAAIREALQTRWPGLIEYGPRLPLLRTPELALGARIKFHDDKHRHDRFVKKVYRKLKRK